MIEVLLALGLASLTFVMMFLITLSMRKTTSKKSFKMDKKCVFCEDNYAIGFMNEEPICDECAMTD